MILTQIALGSDCAHTETVFKCVKYLKNYDGDTITVDIPNVPDIIGKKIPIRINGIDTPEIRTKNKCEKEKGRNAQRLIENILKMAKNIELRNIERGKYFRIVADVVADNQNLADILIKNKLAIKYDGGTKLKVDWCK